MSGYPQQPRVLLATLSECQSAAGKAYLRGWAGASNLVAFRGTPDEQGRPTWDLFLVERQRHQEARQEPPARPASSHQGPQQGARADGPPARRREGSGSRQERAARELIARQDDGGLNDALPF